MHRPALTLEIGSHAPQLAVGRAITTDVASQASQPILQHLEIVQTTQFFLHAGQGLDVAGHGHPAHRAFSLQAVAELFCTESHHMQAVGHIQGAQRTKGGGQRGRPLPSACAEGLMVRGHTHGGCVGNHTAQLAQQRRGPHATQGIDEVRMAGLTFGLECLTHAHHDHGMPGMRVSSVCQQVTGDIQFPDDAQCRRHAAHTAANAARPGFIDRRNQRQYLADASRRHTALVHASGITAPCASKGARKTAHLLIERVRQRLRAHGRSSLTVLA